MKPLLILLFLLLIPSSSSALHTLDTANPLLDGDVLVSAGQTFALGFFSPKNSNLRYLGIWFNKVSEQTVVWVANRDAPLNGTYGCLALGSTGDLNLFAGTHLLVWSARIATPETSDPSVRFFDTGNLVVMGGDTGKVLLFYGDPNSQVTCHCLAVLWQSFDYPTDTILPYMKLGVNRRTGSNWSVSSWKSESDPSPGSVVYRIDPTGYPQLVLYKNRSVIWRGGPWTGVRWSGVPEMSQNFIFNFSFVNDDDEVSIYYGIKNDSSSIYSRMYLDESGVVKRYLWTDHQSRWNEFSSTPKGQCENYRTCGPNTNCDPTNLNTFICKCLPGFEPKSKQEWEYLDGSSGCVRQGGKSTCRREEGFAKLARVKLPDTSTARVDVGMGLKECEEECLRNCSCVGYTSADERGIGCLRWHGDLVDIRTFASGGQDFYVRVDANVLATYNKSPLDPAATNKSNGTVRRARTRAMLIVSAAVTALLLLISVPICVARRHRKARDRVKKHPLSSYTDIPEESVGSSDKASTHLPSLMLSEIVVATNDFANENKLGEGGFGSVYKGTNEGNEIAVKRLSRNSGQGMQEFKNEVEVIAKLQHRNLVRILGFCVEEHEKMLIYEYLPNKSLDKFIFDGEKKPLLDWPIRYNIICGIARGILYLHEDSRLKIIHRDLKASNVLLDASMNPKISDFGMARIFGVDQDEGSTNRVVGTYGYMAPEYAMHGLFSVKSDVYSFGVLLLETVSGRKNSSYYEETTATSLVGYAWELWRQGKATEIVDSSIKHPHSAEDMLRCIQIGLLCVQESPTDRPNMFQVVFMLCNVESTPPVPRKPAFILQERFHSVDEPSASTTEGANSVNNVTITTLEPR